VACQWGMPHSLAAWQVSKLLRGHAHEISAHHGAGTES